jgi:hypothetical protein
MTHHDFMFLSLPFVVPARDNRTAFSSHAHLNEINPYTNSAEKSYFDSNCVDSLGYASSTCPSSCYIGSFLHSVL